MCDILLVPERSESYILYLLQRLHGDIEDAQTRRLRSEFSSLPSAINMLCFVSYLISLRHVFPATKTTTTKTQNQKEKTNNMVFAASHTAVKIPLWEEEEMKTSVRMQNSEVKWTPLLMVEGSA